MPIYRQGPFTQDINSFGKNLRQYKIFVFKDSKDTKVLIIFMPS